MSNYRGKQGKRDEGFGPGTFPAEPGPRNHEGAERLNEMYAEAVRRRDEGDFDDETRSRIVDSAAARAPSWLADSDEYEGSIDRPDRRRDPTLPDTDGTLSASDDPHEATDARDLGPPYSWAGSGRTSTPEARGYKGDTGTFLDRLKAQADQGDIDAALAGAGLGATRLDRELLDHARARYDLDDADAKRLDDLGARIASARELRNLIAEAKRRGYNRAGGADGVLLSNEGVHVLSPMMFHDLKRPVPDDPDLESIPCEEHLRVHALLATPHSQEATEAVLDLPIKGYQRLTKLARRLAKRDPSWDEVLEWYVALVEQTRTNPASVGFTGPPTGDKEMLTKVPASALLGLDPWYVDGDMQQLIEASTLGIREHPLDLRDLVTSAGFCVLERPLLVRSAGWQAEVPIRAYSWTPTNTGLWCFAWLDLNAEPLVPGIHAPGYRARLWPAMHFEWVSGEPVNQVLGWSNASEAAQAELVAHRSFLMALWLISGQRIATITGQLPVRAQRKAAERLRLVSTVNVITLRRRLPMSYRDSDHEPEPRHYSHRFPVRAHPRRIWDEKQQRVRIIMVSAYIKGDESLPLIIKDRFFRVIR